MIIEHKSYYLKKFSDKLMQLIHAIDKHTSDCKMLCGRAIPYVVDTWKNIHLNSDFFDEFSTALYNDKNCIFEYLLGKFTKHCVNNIAHKYLLKEHKFEPGRSSVWGKYEKGCW